MDYLITGGAGFIGSHVADTLVARGHGVTIVDDFSTGRRANIEALVANGVAELVEGSVTDEALIDELMQECDRCLHLASTVGVKLVVSRPLETLRTIVHGTDVVISAAARHDKRVLFASTSEVYGKASDEALSEDSDRVLGSASRAGGHTRSRSPTARRSPTAITATRAPRRWSCGCSTRSVRASAGATGWSCRGSSSQALAGEDLTVYGDGTQTRCFLHVRDAVAGCSR